MHDLDTLDLNELLMILVKTGTPQSVFSKL